jgi:putative modified peptide
MAKSAFTPQLVDALLSQLSTNPKFREAFKANPQAALHSIGAPPDFQCDGCMTPKNLASMDEIRHSLHKFREALLGKSSHLVFNLESAS